MDITNRKTVRWDLMKGAGGHYVLCEVLRLVYDEIYNLPKKKRDKITGLLVDGMVMSKKMSDRLHYYRETYGDKTGHKGRHLRRVGDYAKRKLMRKRRKVC
jgi:hypothetical protein